MVSEAEFLLTFHKIKCLHNDAFRVIDNAVRCEENEIPLEALQNYRKGVEIIDEALATPVGLPDNVESIQDQWNEACKMIHKLKRARAEVIQRVGVLNQKYVSAENVENSGTGNNASNDCQKGNGRPRTYTELAQALREMQCCEEGTNSLELLFSCGGVRLYHIKPNGLVTTTSEDSILRIVRLEKDESKQLNSTFFIQIIKSTTAVPIRSPDTDESDQESPSPSTSFCIIPHPEEPRDNFNAQDHSSWLYPLVTGVSPCFRTEYGAFIFPDLEAVPEESGSSFGIMIPTEDNADQIVLEILESILHGVVIGTKSRDIPVARDMSTSVSDNIVRGAQCVSQNIVKGAEKAGHFMTYSTPYLISKIKPAPSNVAPVSENVNTTIKVVKNVTGAAASVTGYIANKVGSATMALGRFMAPHVQKHGSTLLSKGFGLSEEDANNKMNGVLTIAAGAVEGFGTVYCGLEDSAKILGNNLSNNSVKIIQHKYGPSAGSVALGTFDTVGNVINFSQNINYMTPKGIAKRTAKNAGHAIIEEYRPSARNGRINPNMPASTIYPNLTALEAQIKK